MVENIYRLFNLKYELEFKIINKVKIISHFNSKLYLLNYWDQILFIILIFNCIVVEKYSRFHELKDKKELNSIKEN